MWYSSTDTFTVTFDANGGSGTVPSAETKTAGGTINLPGGSSLSKDGFIFGGWNTERDGKGVTYGVNYLFTVIANVTLYAKWDGYFSSISDVRNC
jgi:uncharacterized repeat protein (TIGR02543 family)